jgi:SRSO17 transposase
MRAKEAENKMTKRLEVAPAPAPLEEYIQHFDPLFGKSNQREGFRQYLEGVLLPSERHKRLPGLVNTEPVVGAHLPRAQKLQWFLSESDWEEGKVQAERLRLLREDATTAPNAQGVLVIDETGDRKDGHKTAHVGRQYLGNLGKVDNGVVSVTSLWADEQVYYPLETEPYTPESYFAKGRNDPDFRTKLKIALQLVQKARQLRWPFRAVVADCISGEDRTLREELRALGVPYVMALKPSHNGRASTGRGRVPARGGPGGRLGKCQAPRQVGPDHQNLPRWQQPTVVGLGDRGRTLWARQDGTSGGSHDRSRDLARSDHLVVF